MFHYFSRSLEWLSTGASFVLSTSCFKYMGYNTFFHVMIDVLNLKVCFATDVLRGQVRYPSLAPFFPFWSKPPNGVLLFYCGLEKVCSVYPRLTGSTFLFNIMWKGQPRDSPRLALVWLFHKNYLVYSIFHYPGTDLEDTLKLSSINSV